MILNGSKYIGNLDMHDVAKQVAMLDLQDEYKEEFLDLISQL
jgi:Ca-activated chloride channel family protein